MEERKEREKEVDRTKIEEERNEGRIERWAEEMETQKEK